MYRRRYTLNNSGSMFFENIGLLFRFVAGDGFVDVDLFCPCGCGSVILARH